MLLPFLPWKWKLGPCNSSYCTFQIQPFSTYTDLEADLQNHGEDIFGCFWCFVFSSIVIFRKFMLVETANKESSKNKICHPQDSIGDGIFFLGEQIKGETDSRMVKMV